MLASDRQHYCILVNLIKSYVLYKIGADGCNKELITAFSQ